MNANNTKNLSEENILFEDNHLIVINKKPSQIVQGDKTGDVPLSEMVKEYIKVKYQKPGNVFLGVVHRIDRPASGIVVFAKTGKALSRMNNLLKQRAWKKTYWAIVKNPPKERSGKLVHYLKRISSKNKSIAFQKAGDGLKEAILNYKILHQSDHYFLLEVIIETGRHHQIRSQLSFIGSPIKGDVKYGFDRPNSDASIHLHARSVHFLHPTKREMVRIVAPTPEDNLWDFFNKDSL